MRTCCTWVAILVCTASFDSAEACRICFPLPKKSIADHLIESKAAVLAREDPQRPFHYRAIEVLKGVPPKEPCDLFLDSGSRRILKVRPTRSVLLTWSGKWLRVTMVDAAVLPVVREILRRAKKWRGSATARFEYFAGLFGHANPVIGELAHLEVARAPYASIREFGRRLPREKVRARLRDARYMEWWALHILLLGQSEDARDRRLIVDTVRSLAKFNRPLHLGAWATAYIEIDPDRAIEFLETHYFARSRRIEELRDVVLAFSVQGKLGRRDRIVASYKVLLDHHPALASAVLDDLIAWEHVAMVPYMKAFGTKHARTLMPDARFKLQRFTSLR